ncbi:interferon-inducible GTPase 5-like [Megalops cyprinoides]|uniref:interferon-inducible GTPase 5-like n=1 Tax=Megalops cyprinoides TaxID=118141 RepID=UPI0018653730|nr:interferon-inducible GTPase 5-like [Megalops cyprinoides]
MSLDDAEGVISPEEMQTIKQSLENESLNSAAEKIQKYFDQLDKTVLNMAVTGVSGKGKSTFINTIRGLGDEEEASAPTGETETTMDATPYSHPKFPNIKLWDLPGIGTEKFRPDQYLEQVGFQRYDFFIIISSERFTCNDANLAREIHKMGKHFYFARSKVDESLRAKAVRKNDYNETSTLKLIREDCITGLQKLGVESPRVFLISSFDPEKYDFTLLQEEMEKDLPQEKRHVFLLALPNITESVYQKKKKALQSDIWRVALLSGAAAAVPITGLGFAVDVKVLKREISKYYRAFGLDKASLRSLADRVKVPVEELRKVTKSGIKEDLTDEIVIKMLTKVAGGGLMASKGVASMLPLFGSLASGGIAFCTSYCVLKSCLEELAEDANLVLLRAFPNEAPKGKCV